jgi:aspartate/methionine/tyrosine aminotransferase
MRLKSLEDQLNISAGKAFPYAPSYGRPDLRKKWKSMIYEKNPVLKGKEISAPVVTNALTHGLSMIGYLFLDEGDKVILPDLFWGNYNLTFKNAYKADIETFNLFKEQKFDVDSFKIKLNEGPAGKKIVLLNFPNNPTGYTPDSEIVQQIVKVLKESADAGNNLVVIADDAYFGLVYEEGIEKQSVFAYLAGLHENILAVKVDGPTKEDYVWGFRVGFITYAIKGGNDKLYAALEDKTAGAVRGNISNACNLSQSLLLSAYESETYQSEKKQKYDALFERYKKVKQAVEMPQYEKYFKPLPFNSGYFMCIQLNEGLDGEKIRRILLDRFDTGVISMGKVIRVAFSSVAAEDITTLFNNIYEACSLFSKDS